MVVIRGWGLGEEKWGQGRYEVPRWDPSRLWATELESPSYHAEAKLAWTTPAQRTGPSWAWVWAPNVVPRSCLSRSPGPLNDKNTHTQGGSQVFHAGSADAQDGP